MEVSSESIACNACSKIFSAQKDLDEHLVWHNLQSKHMQSSYVKLDRIEIVKCTYCTQGFLDRYTYDKHQEKYFQKNIDCTSKGSNNFEKPYTCGECGWRFVKKATLNAHSFLHKPFLNVCECGIGFYKKCDLDAHRRLVHPNAIPTNSTPNKVKLKVKSSYKTGHSKSEKEHNSEVAQTESENEQNRDEKIYRPFNPVLKPKLKATLILKQPNKKVHSNIKKNGHLKKEEDTEMFICPICNESYSKKSRLDLHMTTHEEVQQNCDKCPKKFPNKTQLLQHKRSHKRSIYFDCNICNKKLKAKTNLETHMRTHTGEKPYSCHICKKSFSQTGSLKLHLLRHTGVKDFKCDECEKEFYTLSALSLHRRTHTGEKPFECKVCGKSFADPSAYKRHELLHTGLKPHRCKLCPKAFADYSALTVHVRRHAGWTIRCPTCNKSFKNRSGLHMHIKIEHTMVKAEDKFECHYCHKDFLLKQYLVGHMQRVHLKVEGFFCNICGKKFQTKPYLKNHVRCVHDKKFKFKCDVCEKPYYNRFTLERHRVTHEETRARTYECDDCPATFFNKSLLLKHISLKHLRIYCKDCKKVFSTTLKLKQHESEGCRRCLVCHKAFPTMLRLYEHYDLSHARISDLKLHECDKCFKQYRSRASLRRHKYNYHNESGLRFTCDHCNQTYTKRHILKKHIMDIHMISLYCNVCMKRFLSDAEFRKHKAVGCTLKLTTCGICEKVLNPSSLKSHLATHLPKKYECDMCGNKFTVRCGIIRHIALMHTKRTKKK